MDTSKENSTSKSNHKSLSGQTGGNNKSDEEATEIKNNTPITKGSDTAQLSSTSGNNNIISDMNVGELLKVLNSVVTYHQQTGELIGKLQAIIPVLGNMDEKIAVKSVTGLNNNSHKVNEIHESLKNDKEDVGDQQQRVEEEKPPEQEKQESATIIPKRSKKRNNRKKNKNSNKNMTQNMDQEATSIDMETEARHESTLDQCEESQHLQSTLKEEDNKESDTPVYDSSNVQSLETKIQQLKQEITEKEEQQKLEKSKVQKLTEEISVNEQRISELEKVQQESHNKLINKDKTLELFKEKHKSMENDKKQCDKQIKDDKEKIERYKQKEKSQRKEIQQREEEIIEMRKENEKLVEKLSEVMNTKMSRDESDIENINVRNRPMKLRDDYELFCSNTWLQAKVHLDENTEGIMFPLSEQKKNQLLVDIMMDASTKMIEVVRTQRRSLENCISNPFSFQEAKVNITELDDRGAELSQLPDEIKSVVIKYLKQNADDVDIEQVSKDILSSNIDPILDAEVKDKVQLREDLDQFTKEICKLCWKMSIQQPPMMLSVSDLGQPFNEDKHELQFGSADPRINKDVTISYYVHPSLMHGSGLIKKGKVML